MKYKDENMEYGHKINVLIHPEQGEVVWLWEEKVFYELLLPVP